MCEGEEGRRGGHNEGEGMEGGGGAHRMTPYQSLSGGLRPSGVKVTDLTSSSPLDPHPTHHPALLPFSYPPFPSLLFIFLSLSCHISIFTLLKSSLFPFFLLSLLFHLPVTFPIFSPFLSCALPAFSPLLPFSVSVSDQ